MYLEILAAEVRAVFCASKSTVNLHAFYLKKLTTQTSTTGLNSHKNTINLNVKPLNTLCMNTLNTLDGGV